MRIIKKVFGPTIREPKAAPCGHVPPLFRTTSDKYVTFTLAPQTVVHHTLPGAVWCGECHWVKVSDEDYVYYRSFDGNQAT